MRSEVTTSGLQQNCLCGMQRPHFYFTAASQCVFNASAFSCQTKTSQHRNLLLPLSYYWKYKLCFLYWKQANLYWSIRNSSFFTDRPSTLLSGWFMGTIISGKRKNWISLTSEDNQICKKQNQSERTGKAAALRRYEWTRQTRSQTDKQWEEGQVKRGRNVTDSWGRHTDPSPHATWQVTGGSPSSHVHTRMSGLPEGNQVGSVGEVI